jgi:ferrochelatase
VLFYSSVFHLYANISAVRLQFKPEQRLYFAGLMYFFGESMTVFKGEAYIHGSEETIGVLLANLGTPDEPTPQALRRYLAEFLWDPRIVEMSRPLWWLALHGIILRVRPRRSAESYKKVWTEEGSPLLSISMRQAIALQDRLEERFSAPVKVELGMRYGNPSIAEALERLHKINATRVVVLPLYPQYSATTTASTFDAIADELKQWRRVPELRFINSYHDELGYISALAASVREQWDKTGQAEKLLFSFHGTPKRYFLSGDPYFCLCQKTARLVAEQLGLDENAWQVSYQSLFGREEWLKPYTSDVLEEWGGHGLAHLDVICPGFSVDCLETLEEIAMENKEVFEEAGGGKFHYIPALNDRTDHVDMMANLVQKHTQGWPGTTSDWDRHAMTRELTESRHRALAMGAEK